MTNSVNLYSRDWGRGMLHIATITREGEAYALQFVPDLPDVWYARIKGFEDTRKTYGTADVRRLIGRIVPEENNLWTQAFLDHYGLAAYDEWALLLAIIAADNPKWDCTGNLSWGWTENVVSQHYREARHD